MDSLILIIDDEVAILKLFSQFLTSMGYRTITAENSVEAIERFEENAEEIKALVLDVHIPPAGASNFLDSVADQLTGIPLLLVSGKPLESGRNANMEELGGTFLPKPFGPKKLLAWVRENSEV